ncbi:MAG: hypothetical protein AMS19_10685, partial [Gemmatimonas sp. SG8_23]
MDRGAGQWAEDREQLSRRDGDEGMTMKGSGSKGWTPHAVRTAGATIAMLASAACSNATQPGSCDVTLPGGNCLQFEDDDALASRHADIEAAVVDALARSNAV